MISMANNKIRLEKIVIDLSEFKIRRKTTNEDLENYYDSFIEHSGKIKEYFKNKRFFDKCVLDAKFEKRPKLIARETKYPYLWLLRDFVKLPYDPRNPNSELNDKYFIIPRCITKIPIKHPTKTKDKPSDESLSSDIREKFKQYPHYEGIIEIPDDMNPQQTKATTFHESSHYIISRYLIERGTQINSLFARKGIPDREKYIHGGTAEESVTQILTDRLLVHDEDALFESRWRRYKLGNEFIKTIGRFSFYAMGLLVSYSIFISPYITPAVFVPGRIRDYALKKYKESKKEELITPIQYPEFKI